MEGRLLFSVQPWTIINLGRTVLSNGASAIGITPGGTVVGGRQDGRSRAVTWRGTANDFESANDISSFADAATYARDVNSSGWIVGSASLPKVGVRGMLWRPGKHGKYAQTEFASPRRSNIPFTDANRITDGGLIAGAVLRDGLVQPAVVQVNTDGRSSGVIDLTKALPIKHASFGEASDAIDSNLIVGFRGFSYKGTETTRATVWSTGKHGTVYESFIKQLGGISNSIAAVNASGVIAGTSDTARKLSQSGRAAQSAFVATHSRSGWSSTELGLPAGEEASTASDIADNGVIVGAAYRENQLLGTSPPVTYLDDRAVMWQPQGKGRYSVVLLDQLLPSDSEWSTLEWATRVNSDGSILGRGWLKARSGSFSREQISCNFLLLPPASAQNLAVIPPTNISSATAGTANAPEAVPSPPAPPASNIFIAQRPALYDETSLFA